MNCPHCNAKQEDDAVFCDNCGKAIDPTASNKTKCGNCGTLNDSALVFCDNCGCTLQLDLKAHPVALAPVAPPQPSSMRMIMATPSVKPPTPGHPRLVLASDGAYFDFGDRQQLLIGRADPTMNHFPDIDLTAHGGDEGGVSRKHCEITLEGNLFFVKDLGSTNGTFIDMTELVPNMRTPLHNGSQLRLGKVVMTFVMG